MLSIRAYGLPHACSITIESFSYIILLLFPFVTHSLVHFPSSIVLILPVWLLLWKNLLEQRESDADDEDVRWWWWWYEDEREGVRKCAVRVWKHTESFNRRASRGRRARDLSRDLYDITIRTPDLAQLDILFARYVSYYVRLICYYM